MIDVRPGCPQPNESIKVIHKDGITEEAINARINKEIQDRIAGDLLLQQEIESIEAGVSIFLSVIQNSDGSIELVIKNKYGEVIDSGYITVTEKTIKSAKLIWTNNESKIVFTCLDDTTFSCDLSDIRNAIVGESERAIQVENDLKNRLDTEINRAKQAEGLLDTKIEDEIDRATVAEEDIINDLTAEVTRATNVEGQLSKGLSQEATRAIAAEAALNASISNETTAREAADATLDNKITAERNRALGAEEVLEQSIEQEVQDRSSADIELAAAISNEQARAQTAEGNLTINLNNEITARRNDDTVLQNNISAEASTRSSADSVLDTKINSEISRATNAENALNQNLFAEANTRSTADANLQANITILDNKLNYNVHIETNQDEITYLGDTVTKTSPYRNLQTGATGSRSEVIHLANSTTAGLMAHSDYNQIRDNTSRIEALEGQTRRILYTEKADPTAQEIQDFVDEYLESIHITPSPEEYISIAVVVSQTYHTWHYYNDDGWKDDGTGVVTPFTNDSPGIIQGKAADGFVYAENDGTGSVYGWDSLKTRVSNAESSIVSLGDNKVDKVTGSSLVPDTKISEYDAHLVDTDNPHNVTKAQLGLGNVDNTSDLNKPISTATQEALDDKVDKVAGSSLVEDTKVAAYDAHLENTSNPHQVTKAQVGLGNVDNKSEATIKADFTGSISEDNTGFALGGDVYTELGGKVDKETGKSLIENSKVISYDNHLLDTSNPHAVTAAQVGLGNVVNTGDSATPVLGGTDKFTTGGAYTELAKKVDKEAGKGLSTNDFTDSYKSQVEANTTARHTHSNKQALDTISQSDITSWNNKVSANDATIRILVDNVEVDSFTLNQSNDESINITTATKIESISIDDYTLPISHKNVNVPTVRTDTSNQELTGTQKINAKTNLDLNNVDNTSDLNKPVSTAQREAIDLVASNLSSHESDTSNPHSVTKAQVGLGNVDNKSEATIKSDFTGSITSGNTGFVTGGDAYTALDGKVDKETGKSLVEDTKVSAYDAHLLNTNNPHSITKSQVGLGNVDNTSDATKKSNFTGSITSGNTGFVTGGDVYTELNTKVDKVQGKGLSEEDFTSTLKTKLEGIESGAEVNVNADWNASSGDAQILNKPTTIAGYGITDAYTRAETKIAIDNVISELDLSEVGANGSYIKLVSQTDGQLAATAQAFDTTIPQTGASSTNAPTSAAVVSYVSTYGGKIDSISLNGTALTIDQNKNVDIPVSLTSTVGSEAVNVNGTSLNVLTRDTAQGISAQKTIASGVKLAFGTNGNYIKGVHESGDANVLEIYSDYLTRILGVTTLDTASIANLNLDTFGDYRTVRNVGWFDSKISSMYEDTSSGESEWKKSTYGVKLPDTTSYAADKVLATTDDITTSLINYYTSSQTDALLDTKQNDLNLSIVDGAINITYYIEE